MSHWETPEGRIAYLESIGALDPDCPGCKPLYENPGGINPPHIASARCQSGRRPHCTCDTRF